MARSINYETTTPPPVISLGTGPNAANLGKRSDIALGLAFDKPSAAADGVDDGASRNTEGGQVELLRIARDKMGEAGGNPMFPQYRRSFIPGGESLADEYVAVRDKNTVTVGVGTGLGSAYSPTIASPGAQNGINPNNLASVASSVNGVVTIGDLGEVTSTPDTLALDNPSGAVHQNVGDAIDGRPGETGQVRRFRLAVGSGGAGAITPAASRGQFPRPLT